MATDLPAEAIAAAVEAITQRFGYSRGGADFPDTTTYLRVALVAAVPAIRAQERERIRQLAENHDAAYRTTCGLSDCPYNPQRHATHLHPFTDLIGEQ
jgi:hypothetical protein